MEQGIAELPTKLQDGVPLTRAPPAAPSQEAGGQARGLPLGGDQDQAHWGKPESVTSPGSWVGPWWWEWAEIGAGRQSVIRVRQLRCFRAGPELQRPNYEEERCFQEPDTIKLFSSATGKDFTHPSLPFVKINCCFYLSGLFFIQVVHQMEKKKKVKLIYFTLIYVL